MTEESFRFKKGDPAPRHVIGVTGATFGCNGIAFKQGGTWHVHIHRDFDFVPEKIEIHSSPLITNQLKEDI